MENLKQIRNEMLRLHKTLLDIEKANYEAEFGKTTPNQLLQLLFNNERFIWLREISSLIAEIDEMFADKKGVDKNLQAELYQKTKDLIDMETEVYEHFKSKYRANLDTENSVYNHHQIIQNLINSN